MSLLSLDTPALRQALVTGRFTDRVTARGIETFDARLEYQLPGPDTAFEPLPARLQRSRGGYFAFHLDPGREMPRFEGATQVSLRVTWLAPGREVISQTVQIDAADLGVVPEEVVLDGRTARIEKVAGAPFDFSESVDPAPVALAGHVLRDHDPDTPAAGATIEVTDPTSTAIATADAAGWFRIDALPVAAQVTLRVTDGANTAETVIRPDFGTPVNETVLSVSTT